VHGPTQCFRRYMERPGVSHEEKYGNSEDVILRRQYRPKPDSPAEHQGL